MLVKFFKRGGVADNQYSTGGRAVQRYLLGKDYHDGVASREHARLLLGNPAEVTEVINGLDFAKIFTAGCLAFEGEESQRVTEAMKFTLMAEFEQCLFAGLDPSQYTGYWVEHTDKIDEQTQTPRLELNFVFANVELTTGKALPVYYHPIDEQRIDTWKEIKNLEFELADPNALERKRLIRIGNNLPKNVKELLVTIDEQLQALFMAEVVNNRDDVISVLSKQYEITAIKNRSISIKNPQGGNRPIRLQGAFYDQAFNSRESLAEPTIPAGGYSRHRERTDSERIAQLKADYQRLCDKRSQSLSERFKPSPKKSVKREREADYRVTAGPVFSYRPALGLPAPFRGDWGDRANATGTDRAVHRVTEPSRAGQGQPNPAGSTATGTTLESREAGLSGISTRTTGLANEFSQGDQSGSPSAVAAMGSVFVPVSGVAWGKSDGVVKVAGANHVFDGDVRADTGDFNVVRGVFGVPEVKKPVRLAKIAESKVNGANAEVSVSNPDDLTTVSPHPKSPASATTTVKRSHSVAGVSHDTPSSQSAVRERLGSAIQAFIDATTSGIRQLATVVQQRQSGVKRLGELAYVGYQRVKATLDERQRLRQWFRQQWVQQQNDRQSFDRRTANRVAETQSAVSRAGEYVKRAITATARPTSTKDSGFDLSGGHFGAKISRRVSAYRAVDTREQPASGAEPDRGFAVERMDRFISATRQQNVEFDEFISKLARRLGKSEELGLSDGSGQSLSRLSPIPSSQSSPGSLGMGEASQVKSAGRENGLLDSVESEESFENARSLPSTPNSETKSKTSDSGWDGPGG